MVNPVLIERDTMTSIGNAIRNKGGATTPLTPGQMPAAINNISGGGSGKPIIMANSLCSSISSDNKVHNNWDDIKNLIDYDNIVFCAGMFQMRRDLTLRELREFFSHSMPKVINLKQTAYNTAIIDADAREQILDIIINAPKCTGFDFLFFSTSYLSHLKITFSEMEVDTTLTSLCNNCTQLEDIEIVGPGLNRVTNMSYLCYMGSLLRTAIIGEDDTDYSKVGKTGSMFQYCSALKTITIKGINILPLTDRTAIPSTIQSIKVPAALVDSYKKATNWIVYADKISAI